MKYIRTEDNKIYELQETKSGEKYLVRTNELIPLWNTREYEIVKQADTIEELFDEIVFYDLEEECMQILSPSFSKWTILNDLKDGRIKDNNIFGAIWTDKGLIYKAKMKGVLPNGEIDWELL